MRPYCLNAVVAGQALVTFDCAECGEASIWTFGHCHGDRTVQREHWVGRDALEQGVQDDDLMPVGPVS